MSIFHSSCVGCAAPGPSLCRPCRFALAGPLALALRQGRHGLEPADEAIVATEYRGRVRDVMCGFKFGNRRRLAAHLGGLLVNAVVAARAADVDVVTWAPTSARRAGERGFDQAELIAGQVARQLGVPCRRLIDRVDEASQFGRSRLERLRGRRDAFEARPGDHGRVLIVDDIVTTGATLRAAAAALRAAGALDVVTAAVAATPTTFPASVPSTAPAVARPPVVAASRAGVAA